MKRGRNQRRRQGVNINRAFDSNGPDVRIRGTANQIYDKYLALARDATSSGDRVKAENYFQHAEHYFRVIRSMQAAQQPPPQVEANDSESEQPSLSGGKERERQPREAASGDGAQPAKRVQAESGDGAAKPEGDSADAAEAKSGNGLDESTAEGGEAPRRPRRRRPRRSTKSEGEDAAAGEAKESAEAAAS